MPRRPGRAVLRASKSLPHAANRPSHHRLDASTDLENRIRRVKCDEARPSCHRCTSTGRKCDGYQVSSPTSSDHSRSSPESLSVALSTGSPSTALEKRTFDFFRCRTAPSVSGYFPDPVWDRFVLQVSHTNETVRYAVNALAALHEERTLRSNAEKSGMAVAQVKTSFPVAQYHKALQGMQNLLASDNVPMDIVLMCVILCVHFEAIREDFVPALLHMENAIRLLQASTTFDARKVETSLVRSMMRLDLQGSLYLGMRPPGMPYFTASADSTMPHSFHDLTHARDFINTWTVRLIHFMRTEADNYKFRNPGNIPLEILAKSHDFVQTFLDLDRLLWDFMHKPSIKLSIREQHGLGILRSRVKYNRIVAATCLYAEASAHDAFINEFEEIMNICCYIMESDDADRRLFSVSLDEGLLHPFFFVATHCRDSRLRRRALAQLKKLPPKEGIWHVEAMTRTAEVVVDFEESWCEKEFPTCSDIPEWRRTHSAGFDGWNLMTPKPRVTTHLLTWPNGMDGDCQIIQQVISW